MVELTDNQSTLVEHFMRSVGLFGETIHRALQEGHLIVIQLYSGIRLELDPLAKRISWPGNSSLPYLETPEGPVLKRLELVYNQA